MFAAHDIQLNDVTIHAGESALKECSNIIAINCRFEGKYPFWHVDSFVVRNSLFTEGARAALWYSKNLAMTDTRVEAPKMFREMDGIQLFSGQAQVQEARHPEISFYGIVISPISEQFRCSFTSSGVIPCPNRNISLATAHSVVLS